MKNISVTYIFLSSMKIVLIGVLLLLLLHNCFSQSIRFKKITVEDGLAENIVFSVYRDSSGFMWFGSRNEGLSRFDGSNIQVYSEMEGNEHSILGTRINSIFSDSKDRLWVGTNKGLNRYNPEQDNFTRFYPHQNRSKNWVQDDSLADHSPRRIYEHTDGKLWLATTNMLDLFDPKTGKITHFQYDIDNEYVVINDLLLIEDRYLWMTSHQGIRVFDTVEEKFKQPYVYNSNSINSLPYNHVTSLYQDENGKIWVATFGGGICYYDKEIDGFKKPSLQYFDLDKNQFTHFFNLTGDGAGTLYAGSPTNGLVMIDLKTETIKKYTTDIYDSYSISSNNVRRVYYDKLTSNIWLGTGDKGVNYFSKYDKAFKHYRSRPNGLSNSKVKDLLEDKNGNIWIATNEGGINVMHIKSKKFSYFKPKASDPNSLGAYATNSLLEDKAGNIWVGTYLGGLNLFKSQSQGFQRFLPDPNNPFSIRGNRIPNMYEVTEGNILLQVGSQYMRLDNKTNQFYPDTILSRYDRAFSNFIFKETSNSIWKEKGIGKGLAVFYEENGVDKLHIPEALDKAIINMVFKDSQGQIWLATNEGLLIFRLPQSVEETYTIQNGLPSNKIMAIAEDEVGNLWISTNRGISKFEKGISRPNNPIFKNYTVTDGLQGLEFSPGVVLQSSTGELYFGGNNGFNVFTPSEIKSNPVAPPIILTDFRLFNKSVEIGTEDSPLTNHISETKAITLNHTQNIFSFDFVALNYLNTQENEYAYMMEGLDEGWNYVGNIRNAKYTNLDAGNYTFRVKAANNDGVWNEEGISIQLTILPPWWETWWFNTLVVLFIGVAVYTFYKYRTYQLKKRNEHLELQVKDRTQEIQQKQEEILTQNEELRQTQEEIQAQRDHIAIRNKELERKNRQIHDSIVAAEVIQQTILPSKVQLSKCFDEYFVLFKPRDIVSGDFYWLSVKEEEKWLVVADCTGHGVPGAFMTLLGKNILDKLINQLQLQSPSEVLNRLHGEVKQMFAHREKDDIQRGMDLSVLKIGKTSIHNKGHIEYAGAKSNLYIYEKSTIQEILGDRIAIGSDKEHVAYTNYQMEVAKGSIMYLTSDGYQDQNNQTRKRFGRRRLRNLLQEHADQLLFNQKEILETELAVYMEHTEQRDDILLVGIKI